MIPSLLIFFFYFGSIFMCVCYLNVNFDVFNRKIKILLLKIYGKFSFESILILNIKILFNILNRIFKCFFLQIIWVLVWICIYSKYYLYCKNIFSKFKKKVMDNFILSKCDFKYKNILLKNF